jgi:hypothetical protein
MITDFVPFPFVPEQRPHFEQFDLNPISADAGQEMNFAIGDGEATKDR